MLVETLLAISKSKENIRGGTVAAELHFNGEGEPQGVKPSAEVMLMERQQY